MNKGLPIKRDKKIIFFIIAILCIAETVAHRNLDYLTIHCMHDISLLHVQSYYPHAAQFDNDIDDDRIQVEEFGQALNTYYMAGICDRKDGYRMDTNFYPADKYRIVPAFISSLFVSSFTFKHAYLLANCLVWILAGWSIWWLGRHLFDTRTGVIAGLLLATSYAFIVLSTSSKGEMYQLALYTCLVALSFRLEYFSSSTVTKNESAAFLLGTCAGIGVFSSIGTVFFLAFLFSYSLLRLRPPLLFRRSAAFAVGCLLIFVMYKAFLTPSASLQYHSFQLDLKSLWACFKSRMVDHFIYTVPLPLWAGALGGLFLLNRKQAGAIACMFTTLVVSESIMYIAQGPHCFDWSISYYYLQILLPIYLLNGRFLAFLLSGTRERERTSMTYFKKTIAALLIIINLLLSHIGLMGNKYFYQLSARATPIEMLYHSFFTFDNLYVYREKAGHE